MQCWTLQNVTLSIQVIISRVQALLLCHPVLSQNTSGVQQAQAQMQA